MKRLSGVLLFAVAALAQPPIKPIPAAGIEVPAADRAEPRAGLAHLRASIHKLKIGPLLPDVPIYPGMWAAASPGAGFAESALYLKIKITGDAAPLWWEQTLWHNYYAVDYAANLFPGRIVQAGFFNEDWSM